VKRRERGRRKRGGRERASRLGVCV